MKIRLNPRSRRLALKSRPRVSSAARNGPLTKLKQILVPVDFSWPCRIALDYAVALAGKLGAKIHLLHVTAPCFTPAELPVPAEDEAAVRAAMFNLEVLARQTVDPALLGSVLVRTGNPDQEILRIARELKADLILLARHGQTGPKHRAIGSTEDKVVQQAHCPVLIVPAPNMAAFFAPL